MKVSINWIKDFVDLKDVDIEKTISKFTMSVAEVEGIEYKGKDIKFPIDKLDKYANVKMFFRYHASGSNTTFAGDDFVQYFIEQNASYEVFRDVNDYWSKKISSDGSKYVYVKTDAVWPNKRRKTLYYILLPFSGKIIHHLNIF